MAAPYNEAVEPDRAPDETPGPLPGEGACARHAASLLTDLGLCAASEDGPQEPSPAALWARSGAMALTGHADGPPLPAPAPLAACAEGALLALRALAPEADPPTEGAPLLGEHAACLGHVRRGRTSPGGSCRLLRAADGWIAVNLARPEDAYAVPALVEGNPEQEAWSLLEAAAPQRPAAEWVERGRWLSLPVAAADPPEPAAAAPAWLRVEEHAEPAPRPSAAPLVLDLSSLWAGPLCTSLLADAGARVWKLESTGRPDGVRAGSPRFFDLLNGGKESVALDLCEDAGRRALRALADAADVLVEATRPRALRQLGLEAEAWLAARPGRVWLSLTGYGRRDAAPGRVAFGDDAAVAAGLALATGRANGEPGAAPLFCGDAIADPLTGLYAAVAVQACWRRGGGVLLDVALRDVAAHALAFDADPGSCDEPAAPPRARAPKRPARPFGADTRAVLEEVGFRC